MGLTASFPLPRLLQDSEERWEAGNGTSNRMNGNIKESKENVERKKKKVQENAGMTSN